MKARRQVHFADCRRLLGDLHSALRKGTLEKHMRLYEHCSLLIADERGYIGID